MRINKGHKTNSKDFQLLIGTTITLFLAIDTISPILPLYITQKGASILELGFIMAILSFTGMIAKIPLGILSDKVGRWPIIPIALLSQFFVLLLYSLVPNPKWFYPIRVFHALITSAFAPTSIALASELSPRGKEGDNMGRFLTALAISSMFGPFLCSFLLNFYSYPQLMRIVAVIPLIGLGAFLLIRSPRSYSMPSDPDMNVKTSGFPIKSFKKIIFSRNILVVSYLRITFFFTGAFFITLWAVYASESLLFTPSLIALFFGIKGITNTVFRVPTGRFSDRVGYKVPLLLSYSSLVVVFYAFSKFENVYFLFGVMTVYGIVHAIRAVSEWTLLGVSAPPKLRGIAAAYLSTMSNIGMTLGAIAAGALALVYTMPEIFQLAALICIPTVVAPFLIRQDGTKLEIHKKIEI